ncbi:hypothetical protein [Flavobacterium sp. ACN6]|uniref:hypothetical protein n=1 Tax=Flavobacterium sp. ACN6 TaxID=1920426 RepID=UPI000BB3BB1C|nr:hypothetical protein [Flavobacterium sp. ACN6]PBJ13965.1 hypothetical protein BSF42_14440 [Flavobacterium sp. ACN6]
MKNINLLNYFFVGIPAILIPIGYVNDENLGELFAYGLLFSILTGLFQITIGACMLIDNPRDKSIQYYILGVILYFVMVYINPILPLSLKTSFVFAIPTILAIYLSIVIYKKAHK